MSEKSKNPFPSLNEPGRSDADACRAILTNAATIEDATATLSTSELIAVALAFGRVDLLPSDYKDFRSAWRRLNRRQRDLVDQAVKAPWRGRSEGTVC